jgi:hypothetical protein
MGTEDMARTHWAAVAKNDLAAATIDYTDNAVLDWVGCRLVAEAWKIRP